MAGLKSIRLDVEAARNLALVSSSDDSVWLVVSFKWYELATVFWWLLTPSERRARVRLNLYGGGEVSAFAVQVATRHARIRGFG